jgi:hypothetical protein
MRPRFPRWIEVAWAGSALAGLGCGTRDRLTFPSTDGAGPQTNIDRPMADTTVSSDSAFFLVTGTSLDADGVDTLYAETTGGVTTFPPQSFHQDSVRFGLPLTTQGLAGDTIIVRTFATDALGNRGDTAVRRIAVQ